jgi:hypothetical protein
MQADAHVNLLGSLFVSIVGVELGLDRLRALDGVHDGGEFDQEVIAGSLDDMALVGSDGVLDDLVMEGQQLQGMSLVGTHLAAEIHHVGKHDRRQPTGLGRRRFAHLDTYGGDYATRPSPLSNDTELSEGDGMR